MSLSFAHVSPTAKYCRWDVASALSSLIMDANLHHNQGARSLWLLPSTFDCLSAANFPIVSFLFQYLSYYNVTNLYASWKNHGNNEIWKRATSLRYFCNYLFVFMVSTFRLKCNRKNMRDWIFKKWFLQVLEVVNAYVICQTILRATRLDSEHFELAPGTIRNRNILTSLDIEYWQRKSTVNYSENAH